MSAEKSTLLHDWHVENGANMAAFGAYDMPLWYPLGAKIMQVMQKEIGGISTSNGPGGGVGNIKDVSEGNAEIGWSYGHTAYNGYVGRGKFDHPYKNIAFFATLYPGVVQIAVPKNSSIHSISDFKGKNISPGKSGWTGTASRWLRAASPMPMCHSPVSFQCT